MERLLIAMDAYYHHHETNQESVVDAVAGALTAKFGYGGVYVVKKVQP